MAKKQKILTMDQLVKFCVKQKLYSFDSKDRGYQLSVQVPGSLLFEDDSAQGILFCKIKVCHTLLNRNGSYISEENMKKAMPSLNAYRPLLAYIHQLDDGSYDFHSHDIELTEDEDGNEVVSYLEKQIGTFTTDEPYLEYDKEKDKTYVIARVAIPEEYTKAAEIIKEKNGTKVSCELVIDTFSYNAKEKYLEIEDFYFAGCTCLGSEKDGTPVGEGMLGARLDIEDFSLKNNSVCSNIQQAEQFNSDLIKRVADLEEKLASFNIQESFEEGGINVKLEELLKKYNKTPEELNFETDGLTDEELESKFAEEFDVDDNQDPEPKDMKCSRYSIFKDGEEIHSFEISHEDIRYSLNQLISIYDEQDNDWYWCEKVYDDHFVFSNWDETNIWGQKYKVEDDSVSLDGERWKLFRELITESEKAELESMRANYAEIKEELDKFKKNELDAEKEKIFADESYAPYLDKEAFVNLKANKDNYSVKELKDQAEIAFAKCIKEAGSFNFAQKQETTKRKTFSKPEESKKKSPYGRIFSRNKK